MKKMDTSKESGQGVTIDRILLKLYGLSGILKAANTQVELAEAADAICGCLLFLEDIIDDLGRIELQMLKDSGE